ncbi:MAG: hypothetical protein EBU46_14405 [Nitrosomonadaceae bacterium]|nr:hypothetical protein [Nitrosomonadaceae bacterium]
MLETEIAKIPELKDVGTALVVFARSLLPGLRFEPNVQKRFVATPDNFVTFTVHWHRAKNITVTLRGNPDEFLSFQEMPLKPDRTGYSSFKLTEASQLAAAAFYIRRAAEIYQAGRGRVQNGQKVVAR